MSITSEHVAEFLSYDPDTGVFLWRKGRRAGLIAGSLDRAGYRRIKLFRQKHQAHRLAWLLVHGRFPQSYLDHSNLNRDDNRISNLRPATHSDSAANRRKPRNNTSGFKGAQRRGSGYQAVLVKNKHYFYLGTYPTPEEAHAAYCTAAAELFGGFARTT